jgi:isopentenyl-diphosphate Delta-isomerase
MKAHQEGVLHRAFSIFIFNSKGEMLLQKRATSKYHSGGLWSNACCSHPLPDESLEEALQRKLQQELGFKCMVHKKFHFTYKANLGQELTEHEFDHVFTGIYDGLILPNPQEVETFKFISKIFLEQDVNQNPDHYTEWFKLIYKKVY